MGSKIVRVAKNSQEKIWCVWEKEGFFPLQEQAKDHRELVQIYGGQRIAIAGNRIDPGSVEMISPIDPVSQIICLGKNYTEHLLETGLRPEDKDFNLFFSKATSSLSNPRGFLYRPSGIRLLDYELELGLVLQKPIMSSKNITIENILEYVGAIVMANDVSARDVQVPQRQWFKGKSYRGFCPVGPVLYFLEPGDQYKMMDLQLELKVNAKVRQKANTKQMIYSPGETLTEMSGIFDLQIGDLVLTGTPGGVAMKVSKGVWKDFMARWMSDKEKMEHFLLEQSQNPRYLKNGDVIEATIRSSDGEIDLGEQRLTVMEAPYSF